MENTNTLDRRIAAAKAKRDAEEIAAGSGPIVESEWMGGTRYRIANVRHGVMPARRIYDSHEAMMAAFESAQAK